VSTHGAAIHINSGVQGKPESASGRSKKQAQDVRYVAHLASSLWPLVSSYSRGFTFATWTWRFMRFWALWRLNWVSLAQTPGFRLQTWTRC